MADSLKKPWRQYLRLLGPEAPDLRTIVVYGAASAVLTLAVPLTVDALISNITFGTLLTPLVVLVSILLGCLVMQGVLRALQAWIAEVIERRIFIRVVSDLSWRLPRVDIRAFDRRHGPEYVNRFFDTITVQKSSSKLFLELTNIVLTTVVGLAVLSFYHPFFLMFAIGLLVAVAILIFGFGVGGVRTAVTESVAKYEVAAWLQELARNTTAFCTKGGAEFAAERANQLVSTYVTARRRHFRVLFRQICSSYGLQIFAGTTVLAIGGWLVIDQQLTVGQLIASELIVTAVVANITKLGSVLETWYDVCAASDKLGHLVDLPLERQTGELLTHNAPGVAVHLESVRCSASENTELGNLHDLTLTVKPGERVALTGAAGGDSSLLLDVLYGLREPIAGHVTVNGLDLRQLRLDQTRDEFALVHGTEIVDGSIIDNLRFGREEVSPTDVRDALIDVGLWDEIMTLPQGLETELTTGGGPLTAGQATRLMLARAILGEPRLLLLDGPLDALTPSNRETVLKRLFDKRHQWTVLIATNNSDVIAACDRTFDCESAHGEVAVGDAVNDGEESS
ncbi:MAG: putative ABC transport system ATP-binding protein [Planctomycetota bacterium]